MHFFGKWHSYILGILCSGSRGNDWRKNELIRKCQCNEAGGQINALARLFKYIDLGLPG